MTPREDPEKPVQIHPTGSHDPDPAADQQSSHVFATGMGTAAGAVTTGAIGGGVAGPVGAAVGAVVGAVAGAYIARGVEEWAGPTAEEEWLRDKFATRHDPDEQNIDAYKPAYAYAREVEPLFEGRPFLEVEPELRAGWERGAHAAQLPWEQARDVVQDVFEYRAVQRGEPEPKVRVERFVAGERGVVEIETPRRDPDRP